MITLTLDRPPRPADGEGEVILAIDGVDLVFRWEAGEYKGVRAVSEHVKLNFASNEITLGSDTSSDGVSCECCVWPENGGTKVCWPIRCGTSCP